MRRCAAWRTYFGCGVRQAVEGGRFTARRLADEGDERIARHVSDIGLARSRRLGELKVLDRRSPRTAACATPRPGGALAIMALKPIIMHAFRGNLELRLDTAITNYRL